MKPLNTWLKFWSQVEKTPGCWLWSGWADRYGRFNFEGRASRAHVYAYEKCVGPVPAGLEIDHECDNPLCVNPSHLRAVTHRKNWERGSSPTAILRRRTHCVQGHPLSGENLYKRPDGKPYRECLICRRARTAKRNKLRNREPQWTHGHASGLSDA